MSTVSDVELSRIPGSIGTGEDHEDPADTSLEDQEEDTIHRTNRIFRNISCCKTNISGENKVFIFNHLVTYLVYFISVIQGSLEKVGGSITGQSAGVITMGCTAGLYYAQDTHNKKVSKKLDEHSELLRELTVISKENNQLSKENNQILRKLVEDRNIHTVILSRLVHSVESLNGVNVLVHNEDSPIPPLP